MSIKTGAVSTPLFPAQILKVTTTQRDLISVNTEEYALLVYNTTTAQFEYTLDGDNWLAL